MKLYLIRHGETAFSSEHRHNSPDIELTDLGRRQAAAAARRLAPYGIDAIITSTFIRAEETARIIGEMLAVPVEPTDLLVEVRRPTEVMGKTSTAPDVLRIDEEIAAHADDPSWHHSDEENFFERLERTNAFLASLAGRKESAVAAVSHGGMIRMIVFAMLFGKQFTPALYLEARRRCAFANAGISVCDRADDGAWKVVSLNDGAHLGDV